MANVGTVSVTLEARAGAFDSAISKASSVLGKLGEQLTKTKIQTRAADGSFEKASLTLRGKLVEALNRTGKAANDAGKSMGGLGGAITGAASAAAAFASVTAGFNLARDAANAGQASEIFAGLGGDIDKARAAVGGMVDDANLIRKANLAETMGINADSFERLARISTAAAAKTGQSVDFMFDSIITGTARQSKMILDNLGILVSVEGANKRYAKELGKTAGALSDAEKRQAFMNEVFRQGDTVVKQLEAAGISLINPFDRASAQFKNVADDVGALLAPAFQALLPLLDVAVEFIDDLRNTVARLEPGAKALVTQISAFGLAAVAIVGGVGGLVAALGTLATAFAAAAVAALPILLVVGKVLLFVGLLAALAGALRAAWEENLGGIVEKWWAVRDTVKWALKTIGSLLLDLFGFIEKGFDVAIRFVLQSFALIPKLFLKVVENVLRGFEKIFAAGKAAAKALGMEGVAARIGEAQGALAGVRATVQGLGGDIDDAVDTIAEFANPLKLLRTGATGTFKFLFGEGGKDFAASAGSFLRETGNLVGRGWKLLLQDAGVDVDNLILPKPKVKQIAKELDDGVSGGISKEMKKARDQFAALLGKFRAREAAATSPFSAITAEILKGIKEQQDAQKLAAKAGRDAAEALELSRKNTARQTAAIVNGYTSLDEFSKAAEFARERMAAAGISAEEFDEQLRFAPGDFSDVLSKRVGQALDAAMKAGGLELDDKDRKVVVDKFSDSLAGALTGQDLNLDALFEGLGTLIAGADIGGLGTAAGELFGVVEDAADPAVEANLQLATSATGAAAALDAVTAAASRMELPPMEFDLSDAGETMELPAMDFDLSGVEEGASALGDAAGSLSSAAEGAQALSAVAGGGGTAAAAAGGAGGAAAGAGGAAAGAAGAGAGAAAGAGGAGIGGALGSAGGPIGIAVGLAIGAVVAKVIPMVIQAFQTVAKAIVSAAGVIPKAIDFLLDKFASFTGEARLGEAFKAMQIPALGTAAALAAIAGVLSVVFLPVLVAIAGQIAALAVAAAGFAAALLLLAPFLLGLAALILAVLTVVATVIAYLQILSAVISSVLVVGIALAAIGYLLASGLGLVLVVTLALVTLALLPLIAVVVALVAVFALAVASIALAAGLFSLAMKTESFERFKKAFEGSMDRIIQALEPFFENLMWVAGVFDALLSVAIPLADAFANNETAARILFEVVKFVAVAIGHVLLAVGMFVSVILALVAGVSGALAAFVDGMADIPGTIGNLFKEGLAVVFDALASVLENIPGFGDMADALGEQADELRDSKVSIESTGLGDTLRTIGDAALALSPDMDAMGLALADLTDLTFEEAMLRGEILAKEKEASEELTNVPEGFKVVAARFRAIVAEDIGSGVLPGTESSPSSSPGNNFIIEQLNLLADDPESLVDALLQAVNTGGLQFAGRNALFNDGLNNGSSS